MLRRACFACCLLLTAGCGGETRTPPPIDCFPAGIQVNDEKIRDFEALDVPWFASGDATGARTIVRDAGADGAADAALLFFPEETRATENFARVPIEGGRCGSMNALLLTSTGHNDWGSLFGDYGLVGAPPDGTGWDGIAVWARTGRVSDRSVTFLVDTPQTTVEGMSCREYTNDQTLQTFTDPNTGQIVTEGDVQPEDACGNSFRRPLTTTDRWELQLLPFDSFVQEAQPNRAEEGMDTSAIMRITIRPDKGADLELWLDDIAFYRRR